MNIIIRITPPNAAPEFREIYFYGEETAPIEIGSVYWAIRQGGWEEPIDAFVNTVEKMSLTLSHLKKDNAIEERFLYNCVIGINYDREEITLIRDGKSCNIGMDSWITLMDAYFENNLGFGTGAEADTWMRESGETY